MCAPWIILVSVLWRNRQIIACLAFRPKPRNWCIDLEAQITKPQPPVLGPKSGNPSEWFWCQTTRIVATGFETKLGEPSTLVLRLNQETYPWFWGSTKKLTLLISTCMVHTAHDVIRPPDRLSTEYPTCATIPGPLHQVSYSCHDPCCYPPCRTCHLHIMRQANAILHTNKSNIAEPRKCPRFKFKPRRVNDSSHIKPRYWPLRFSISPLMSSLTTKKHKVWSLNPRPHKARLEDQNTTKNSRRSSRRRKSHKINKRNKNSKPSQNGKEEPIKAQKHKKLTKLPLNQLPLSLSIQDLPLR
jgi:hypothetical protein